MGIKQLFSVLKDEAPNAIKDGDIKTHFGRKVAIVRCPAYPASSPSREQTALT